LAKPVRRRSNIEGVEKRAEERERDSRETR